MVNPFPSPKWLPYIRKKQSGDTSPLTEVELRAKKEWHKQEALSIELKINKLRSKAAEVLEQAERTKKRSAEWDAAERQRHKKLLAEAAKAPVRVQNILREADRLEKMLQVDPLPDVFAPAEIQSATAAIIKAPPTQANAPVNSGAGNAEIRRKQEDLAVVRAMRDIESGAGYPIDRFMRAQMVSLGDKNCAPGERGRRREFYATDEASCIRMRPEINSALSFRDFAEADAAGLLDAGRIVRLATLQEGVLHNFSPMELGREIEFENGDTSRFAVAGFALLREKMRVRWIMLGGPVEKAIAWDDDAKTLEGEVDVRRVTLSGIQDLESGAWTLEDAVTENKNGQRRRLDQEPDRHAWLCLAETVAQMLMKVPAYCAIKVRVQRPAKIAGAEVTAIEPEQTDERKGRKESDATVPKNEDAEAKAKRRRAFRVVSTLQIVTTDEGESIRSDRPRRWSEPEFQVDVLGHHRRISESSVGSDFDGKPIIGKTWVSPHLSWRNKPPRPEKIVAKAPVMPALDYAEQAADDDQETTVTFRI